MRGSSCRAGSRMGRESETARHKCRGYTAGGLLKRHLFSLAFKSKPNDPIISRKARIFVRSFRRRLLYV